MTLDVNRLRLEIEVPAAGLPNLVQNPSGEKGAWGWLTPVANTTMSSNGSALTFKTTATQACNFTTDFLPVAATKYVAAQFVGTAASANTTIKVRFDWYDTNKALLSSSVQSSAIAIPTTGAAYVSAIQAPASTVYVKARFDVYTSGGNFTANNTVSFNKAMVTWADTAGGLGTTRTNLIQNPSIETNINCWKSYRGSSEASTLTRTTTQFLQGASSLRVQTSATGSGGTYVRAIPLPAEPSLYKAVPVLGGKNYRWRVGVKSNSGSRDISIGIWYYSPSGTLLNTHEADVGSSSTSVWTEYQITSTVISGATWAVPYVLFRGTPDNDVNYVDKAMFELNNSATTYFDGASTGSGKTYAWTGTANNSTSTETSDATAYAYSEPFAWQNILGPAHELEINRSALNVGTLMATILDPDLDPSVEPEIRPGKKIRLSCDPTGTDAWETVYEGKTTSANVSYTFGTRIVLNASDNITALSNQAESRGMATIANLPYIMETKGVPWNVNGSGNQVASATTVSINPNASVLDQIAVTRDSVLGYAWVDRENVLNAYDNTQTFGGTFDFSDVSGVSYNDIDVNFDTEECINEVTVTWLRYNSASGETTEIVYGPYRNQASIDTWGVHSANFTVQGATESSSAIATYANNILTANATPVIKANTLSMPVLDEDSMTTASTIDLYSTATVTFEDVLTAVDYRVTAITHNITPEKWTVTLGFGSDTAVAAPTLTPSPQQGVPGILNEFTSTIVTTAQTSGDVTFGTSATNLMTATIPYALNGAVYKVSCFNNTFGTAGATGTLDLKWGAAASVGGTVIAEAVMTYATGSRRYPSHLMGYFTFSGTTGATNINIVLVGTSSTGTSTLSHSFAPNYMVVERIG